MNRDRSKHEAVLLQESLDELYFRLAQLEGITLVEEGLSPPRMDVSKAAAGAIAREIGESSSRRIMHLVEREVDTSSISSDGMAEFVDAIRRNALNVTKSPSKSRQVAAEVRRITLGNLQGHLEKYRREAIRIGKRIFRAYRHEMHRAICVKFEYCKKKEKYRDLQAAYYCVMAILGTVNVPAALTTIFAAILARIGLDRFCGCKNSSHS